MKREEKLKCVVLLMKEHVIFLGSYIGQPKVSPFIHANYLSEELVGMITEPQTMAAAIDLIGYAVQGRSSRPVQSCICC